jgi:radical SAM superfamily enzyme YgiQ (UPF0313 family)
MQPAIAPIGLDYVAGALTSAGIETEILDLCLSDEPIDTLTSYFHNNNPELVAMTFRNVDDCFWPSAQSFVPQLKQLIEQTHALTDAPVVLGGVGFSILPQQIMNHTKADFGIRGDGEQALVVLTEELKGSLRFKLVPGLLWRDNGKIRANGPAWPEDLTLPTSRDAIDNRTYFQRGGQIGLETKRGCNRNCIYCADPLAKGTTPRLREPIEVADEVQALLSQGIDVLHLCDSEFNIPISHAKAVCQELIRRGLGERIKWYTYMAVTPFDKELADLMKRSGCAGIDFTGDSASGLMLATYRQPHVKEDLASAVRLCKDNQIKIMVDLLLGGPGETKETLAETIDFMKQIGPYAIGAGLGVRIYPRTQMAKIVEAERNLEENPNIKRKYQGRVDFFRPTFYISHLLGDKPAELIKDLIDGDERFFEPMSEVCNETTDHNYNDNTELVEAIKAGARGAYWDILSTTRRGK